MLNKIGLIGGGNIGGVLAQEIVQRRLARTVALVDVKPPDLAKGKCLDIAEGTPVVLADGTSQAIESVVDTAIAGELQVMTSRPVSASNPSTM